MIDDCILSKYIYPFKLIRYQSINILISAGESGARGYLTEESVPNLQEDLIHCFWLISDIFGTRHVK